MILEMFAGPGGVAEGLRGIGLDAVGFELDAAACATRAAAGHRTIRADLTTYPFEHVAKKVTGLWASPPCTDFTKAGNQAGRSGATGQLIDLVPEWVEMVRPEWIACEQVPPCLPIWREHAARYRDLGYSVWTGLLNAADYGVPQTRGRAYLMASQSRVAHPPTPTHNKNPVPSLFGDPLQPWQVMGEALGWEPPRYLNPGRTPTQPNRRLYSIEEPAPTVAFGHDAANWMWVRPSTTIVGSFSPEIVAAPGWRGPGDGPRQNTPNSVRITLEEAKLLQGFPRDYPLQGSKTKQWQQIGNAVCPPMAAAIVKELTS